MPNGRSGGFEIAKKRLERLLKGLADHTVVGNALVEPIDHATSRPSWSEVNAAAVTTMLSVFPGKRVWVEEQNHSYYILHLDREVHEDLEPQAAKWIVVRSGSPLFGLLR